MISAEILIESLAVLTRILYLVAQMLVLCVLCCSSVEEACLFLFCEAKANHASAPRPQPTPTPNRKIACAWQDAIACVTIKINIYLLKPFQSTGFVSPPPSKSRLLSDYSLCLEKLLEQLVITYHFHWFLELYSWIWSRYMSHILFFFFYIIMSCIYCMSLCFVTTLR